MGAPEAIDYEAVLADLRNKREHLNVTIANIEQLIAMGFLKGTISPLVLGSSANGLADPTDRARPTEGEENLPKQVESDTFFGLSAVEAAKKYLKIVKRPTAMKEIEDALRAGGYLTNSQNFYANLYTAVMRSSDFRKVGKKWGLAEWYIGRRPPEPVNPRKKRKSRRKRPSVPAKTKGSARAGAAEEQAAGAVQGAEGDEKASGPSLS